eukprot:COSAG04_NODE_15913_length_516_cov_0.743405_1_plen_35_part_10
MKGRFASGTNAGIARKPNREVLLALLGSTVELNTE